MWTQRSLLAQPRRVARELLEQLRYAFGGPSGAELRQLPARYVDHRSAGGAPCFVQQRPLLFESAGRPHREADVARRIDEEREGARGL